MRHPLAAALSVLALAVLPARAAADDTAMMANATLMKPVGGEGRVAESRGAGGEIVVLPDADMIVQIGGFGVLGQDVRGKTARDVYDLHVLVGLKTGGRSAPLAAYGALGLDVLSVTTRLPEEEAGGDRVRRGTTLGISAQLGALGRIGDRGLYRVSASYLGAIVPGTGDDLGGLVLQLALGARFD
ncbi:MAG TPA: hypothetical protein VMZ28_27660 [Kofleriaceae bacterium]|nr:hypothetical protein [Kofleriaceae bacterium]